METLFGVNVLPLGLLKAADFKYYLRNTSCEVSNFLLRFSSFLSVCDLLFLCYYYGF